MANYAVAWKASNKTIILKPEGSEDTKTHKIVGQIYVPVLGEIPDGRPQPAVADFLRQAAFRMDVSDFALVTVENNTDNELLDKYEREVDEDYAEWVERTKEEARVENTGFGGPQYDKQVSENAAEAANEAQEQLES